jgi:DNA replication protein DnaC
VDYLEKLDFEKLNFPEMDEWTLEEEREWMVKRLNGKTRDESACCDGSGWVAVDTGKFIAMKVCVCKLEETRRRQLYAIGDPDADFENFRVDSEYQQRMLNTAIAWEGEGWLSLLGQSGAGKSHLAISALKKRIAEGEDVHVESWTKYVDVVKKRFEEGSKSSELKKRCESVEVLLLDDLFKGKVTDADIQQTFELLNARYCKKLATIITSEMTIRDMLNIDQAIAGRIGEMSRGSLIQLEKDMRKNYRLQGLV